MLETMGGGVNPDVTSANGYELSPGESVEVRDLINLNRLWFDTVTNGNIVSWLKNE